MARYSAFLGRAVEVHYRAGDICLPASGTFVADSGRSIFLEQHYEQLGQLKNFRWEIPYQCIVRLAEVDLPVRAVQSVSQPAGVAADTSLQANSAHAAAGSSLLPLATDNKSA